MNFNEQFEDDLYVAELSRNLSMPDDNDDEQDDNNIKETQVEETQVEENVRSRGRGRGRGRGVSRDVGEREEQNVELSPPPFLILFNILNLYINLPQFYLMNINFHHLLTQFFVFFFSLEQIKIIVKNTNIYAYAKKAGEGRKWKDLTIEEFRIWLSIIIYAGIFKLPSICDYWNKDSIFPEHKITNFMTSLRFEQIIIKRYMHISDCTTPLTFWYSKVKPLATHIRTVSQSICIPSSNVSINIMWHCVVIRIEVIAL
ncbi:piggyBac transposable element-derived protein 4-like [Rhizophagus clarus]|uniref:PiggyBac transposable element-derived protein 4-like n=1 Tax=Rhizophagus clarus TaxID=94130 RepID=A0A8H3L7U4_9GLOM|nr:piggyBac transposable element-derived protein 4-like [Rhizophagus clarus]